MYIYIHMCVCVYIYIYIFIYICLVSILWLTRHPVRSSTMEFERLTEVLQSWKLGGSTPVYSGFSEGNFPLDERKSPHVSTCGSSTVCRFAVMLVCGKNKILLCEPLRCSPAAESALHLLIRCSESCVFHVFSSREGHCF